MVRLHRFEGEEDITRIEMKKYRYLVWTKIRSDNGKEYTSTERKNRQI